MLVYFFDKTVYSNGLLLRLDLNTSNKDCHACYY